eukprot:4074699-Alexandrium_andersonii.AAC.1
MQIPTSRAALIRSTALPVCTCASRDRAPHSRLQGSANDRVARASRRRRRNWSLAMDYAMRQKGLPSHSPRGEFLGKPHNLQVHEDNQAMLAVVRSGRNPTTRYLRRARRVSVQRLRAQLGPSVPTESIRHEEVSDLRVDIRTQTFAGFAKWTHVCDLVNMALPSRLSEPTKAFSVRWAKPRREDRVKAEGG